MSETNTVERPVKPKAPMRAWRVYVPSWGDTPQAVTMATSRSKAHARNHATATGVGYALKWGDFRVVRAPEFDSWLDKHGAFSWAWEHVQKIDARFNAGPARPPQCGCAGYAPEDGRRVWRAAAKPALQL